MSCVKNHFEHSKKCCLETFIKMKFEYGVICKSNQPINETYSYKIIKLFKKDTFNAERMIWIEITHACRTFKPRDLFLPVNNDLRHVQ